MTTYNELAGLRVNYVSSDPTLNTGNEGQVWYNSTSGTLKSLVQLKAWSSASNMGTARYNLGGAGIQTAGLAFGGSRFPMPPNPKPAVCVPQPAKEYLAVPILPAALHAFNCTNDFNVPDVELYHTCPSLPVLSVGSELT